MGREPCAVGERDHDLVGVADDMVVGHDQTGRIDDEARAGAHRLLAAIAEAAAKLSPQRCISQFRRQLTEHIAARDGLRHRDVHHGRQHTLDQRREAAGESGRPHCRALRSRRRWQAAGPGSGPLDARLRSLWCVLSRRDPSCVCSRWHANAPDKNPARRGRSGAAARRVFGP